MAENFHNPKRLSKKWFLNFWPHQYARVFHLLILFRSLIISVYEKKIVPVLVDKFSFIFLPIVWGLNIIRIKFVMNIALGTGHIISDFDNFLRLRHSHYIASDFKYFVVLKNNSLASGFAEIYGSHANKFIVSTFWYNILNPILLSFPELAVDVGLSRIKHRIKKDSDFTIDAPFTQIIPKIDGYNSWLQYYKLKKNSYKYQPLLSGNWENHSLWDFIGSKNIALVHVKTKVMNATALPTDPLTYQSAIEYLTSLGMTIIKIGDEPMPEIFQKLGVIDYPKSQHASFANDLRLVRQAQITLVAGSGVGWLPDLMERPQVYLNFWHTFTPPFSEYCILVPTLISNIKKPQEFLSFREQFRLYSEAPDRGAEVFPSDEYTARNATADEVLAAVKECLINAQKKSSLTTYQKSFSAIDKDGWLAFAQCRVSEYFIEKHRDILKR